MGGPKHRPVTGATPISEMIAALLLGITTKLSNILRPRGRKKRDDRQIFPLPFQVCQ